MNTKLSDCCVGNLFLSVGNWYTPIGKTPQECTYCEYCVNNGCITKDEIYKLDAVGNCNCDCPAQKNHPRLKGYTCQKHSRGDMLSVCMVGTCKNCKGWTSTTAKQYCDGCSAILNLCMYCGQL